MTELSEILVPLKLSLIASFSASLLALVFGGYIALILCKKFRGKELIDILITLPMVLPPTVVGYYLIVLLGRNGIVGKYIYQLTGFTFMFNLYGSILAAFIIALPIMVKSARTAFESVDAEFINASYTLGHSKPATFFKIILPLAKKGIITGFVLSFARCLGEFGASLMVAGNIEGKTTTTPLAIYNFVGNGEWDKANILVIIYTVFAGSLLYFMGRIK